MTFRLLVCPDCLPLTFHPLRFGLSQLSIYLLDHISHPVSFCHLVLCFGLSSSFVAHRFEILAARARAAAAAAARIAAARVAAGTAAAATATGTAGTENAAEATAAATGSAAPGAAGTADSGAAAASTAAPAEGAAVAAVAPGPAGAAGAAPSQPLDESAVRGHPMWAAFKGSLGARGYFGGELQGSARCVFVCCICVSDHVHDSCCACNRGSAAMIYSAGLGAVRPRLRGCCAGPQMARPFHIDRHNLPLFLSSCPDH